MNISELRDRILTLPALEKRMTLLRKDIREAESKLSTLLWDLRRESRDVEQLTEKSLAKFLLTLVGKYEDKLDKEQREEIAAKLAYDRAAAHVEQLLQEQKTLALRISNLRDDEKAYCAELERRRSELKGRITAPENAQLAELENERSGIISQVTEIREAQSAAARAKATAARVLESLERAKRWATYDVIAGNGIISHMAKYSHIDSAEQDFYQLSSQLRNLKSELADVRGLTTAGLSEISSTQRAVDFWFDNIFTDLSVRGQIKDNAAEVSRLLGTIRAVEASLKSSLSSETARLENNKLREEELLLSLGLDD